MSSHRSLLPVFAILSLAVAGCGSEEFETASVKGTVTINGDPVQGGTITLMPIAESNQQEAGKPASGTVAMDGTYTLSTYGDGDGAVIGKHRVTYSAPVETAAADPNAQHAASPPPSPYAGKAPTPAEAEVKSGGITLDIELK